MKRKLKTLTEQFTDARTNYNRILGRGDKGLITEQREGGGNSVSGQGIFSTKTNSIMPFTQEIIDYLSSQGVDTSFWKGGDSTDQPDKPDLPLEIPTADKVDTDVDTLNEQTTNGYYWVSCNCGLQGIWVPQWQGAYCPSQNMGNGTIQSTYWFAFNNTVNGQAPSGGDIWYYDHASMNTGTFPTGYHTVEVVPGSISPSTNNTTPLIGLDFNSCTCGNDCPISSCDTTPASACATQWFQNPTQPWAANWITARDCSNYTWPSINLVQQATAIMAGAPTPQTGPYNNASDIWAAGNASGLPTSPINLKAQFIAKMAKGQYSLCQKQACNC